MTVSQLGLSQRPRRAISLLLFPVIGFISFGSIPKDFFPPQDRDMFEVIIEMPQGTSAEKTLEKAIDVRNQIIESIIPLKRDIWFVGSRLPRVLMNMWLVEILKREITIQLRLFYTQKILSDDEKSATA